MGNQDEANCIEKFFITWFASLNLAYNPTWNHAGRGEVSQETRDKLRQANLGKKLSVETKKKIGIASQKNKSKSFSIMSPDKINFSGINRTKFCKEHGLNIGNFNEVLNGKRKHHKGWSLDIKLDYHTSYTLVSPDGKIIKKKHIKDFCDEFGLTRQHLYRLIKGELNQYRGWKRP